MTNLEIVNLLQRITGLTAFALITLQIYMSTNRKFLKLHMLNGILAYTFVFLHPLLMVVYRYFANHKIDPFYVYTDLCVLCDGTYETYINFGRIAFYLITLTVVTAKFRNISAWVSNNWRKLHIINYVVFYLVSIHAYNVGTDFLSQIFIYLFWFCQAIVAYAIIKRIVEWVKFKIMDEIE